MTSSSIAILPSLVPKLPYDQATAFAPVTLLGRAPIVAVVRSNSPLQTAESFLGYAREHPGKLTYGSPGPFAHLAAELLKLSEKLYITHVPYRGASPMLTDLLGGQIDVAFATLPSVVAFLSAGKLRALAVTSPQRSEQLPAVATFAEAGVKGYEAEVWYGVFAPGRTPESIIGQLHAALRRATETEDFRKRAANEGLTLTLGTPDQTRRILREEESKWRRVVREQSIQVE